LFLQGRTATPAMENGARQFGSFGEAAMAGQQLNAYGSE